MTDMINKVTDSGYFTEVSLVAQVPQLMYTKHNFYQFIVIFPHIKYVCVFKEIK